MAAIARLVLGARVKTRDEMIAITQDRDGLNFLEVGEKEWFVEEIEGGWLVGLLVEDTGTSVRVGNIPTAAFDLVQRIIMRHNKYEAATGLWLLLSGDACEDS